LSGDIVTRDVLDRLVEVLDQCRSASTRSKWRRWRGGMTA
jgi:hypothetical protein